MISFLEIEIEFLKFDELAVVENKSVYSELERMNYPSFAYIKNLESFLTFRCTYPLLINQASPNEFIEPNNFPNLNHQSQVRSLKSKNVLSVADTRPVGITVTGNLRWTFTEPNIANTYPTF